jgi:mannose-6-phosphate isomerase-like protein (cupin superfamily)
MFSKSVASCTPLIARDGCRVFELLHEKNDPIDLSYSLAVAEVEPGGRSYRHRLRQTEVYYVLEGHGRVHVGNETADLSRDSAVLIPGGTEQWIENLADQTLRFIAIVSPPWSAVDDERLD